MRIPPPQAVPLPLGKGGFRNGACVCSDEGGVSVDTVHNIIVEVVEKVCDEYCKWPEKYGDSDEEQDKLMEEHCDKCVLNRLI